MNPPNPDSRDPPPFIKGGASLVCVLTILTYFFPLTYLFNYNFSPLKTKRRMNSDFNKNREKEEFCFRTLRIPITSSPTCLFKGGASSVLFLTTVQYIVSLYLHGLNSTALLLNLRGE
ncbi:hypothetical protein C1H87_19475 [Flavivirga eckloniae]|uniref:Transmembrane protein n=1 Tax=Flavivirga eckloniae TaxID=1803846 RepID=A0A2K9PUN1_9FLAO|nr:hypothetical protein C1H87_19475 [Flavivirga eckloniae]